MTKKINGSEIAISGAAAEGNGALAGWRGLGKMTRAEIIEALAEAGAPVEWAPQPKSAVGYAGRAVSALSNLGYITRRARKAPWRKGSGWELTNKGWQRPKTRAYQARWMVAVNGAADADVGDAAGTVRLTVELHDGNADLHLEGDADLAARVRADYEAARDAEEFSAGDVTDWLRRVLIRHCGATRFGVGYYVPLAGRDLAERVTRAIASRWGCDWICPLLPVATSAELQAGIARGFYDEIRKVSATLQAEREKARKDGKAEISAAVAARLLRDLGDVDQRADAYRVLCGDAALADAAASLRALHVTLEPLADDASQRFALLELDAPTTVDAPETEAPAIRAAEAAAEARRSAPKTEAAPVEAPKTGADPEPSQAGKLRDMYRQALMRSGMAPAEFKSACRRIVGSPEPTPEQWAQAAEAVAADVALAASIARPLEFD